MTKEVLVSIKGAHTMEGETDDISVITAGSYYLKNGRHYIIYDELIDGMEGAIRNTLKISKDRVDMIKSGGTRSHMVFETNKENVSCYATPYGQMTVGVYTNSITVREEEERLQVKIDYTLEFNYENVSDCLIEIGIESKAGAKLHLGE